MGELYTFKGNNSLSRDKLNCSYGTVKNIHYGDIHTKFHPIFDIENEIVPYINQSESLDTIKPDNYCIEGDMVFADASEDLEDIGKSIEVVRLNNERVLAGLHTILARQKNDTLIIRFGGHLFQSTIIRNQIKKEAQGAKVLGISAGRLSKIVIWYPSDKDEQQKIADCLSSIDELITLEGQKLDALKAYKKGLIQQLFPAEGETAPRLRFPEFRDAGEWKVKKAGTLFMNRTEKGEDGLPIYSVTMNDGMIKRSLLDRKCDDISEPKGNRKVYKNDIAYNMMRMWQGAFGIAIEDCMASPAYVILAPLDGACSIFYGYLFKLPKYLRLFTSYSRGLTSDRLRLYYKDFAQILLPRPALPEQQRIASFLSSIDKLITAQSQKIEALKAHKKGLMQQLFPVLDEVRR
jgi:type I restriction enzyme S subunit